MKKNTITYVLFFCLLTTHLFSQTIYVNHAATGSNNGSSWTDAYTTIGAAISAAAANDQIWVAQGTYKETYSITTAGVSLYGGFAGTETMESERNWNANPTILSGDMDSSGSVTAGDTSNMITLSSANARLDGFIVEYTNNRAVTISSFATIQNCIFRHSIGPGVYFSDSVGSVISNSLFYELSTYSTGITTQSTTLVNVTIPYTIGIISVGGTVNFNNSIILTGIQTSGFGGANYNNSISSGTGINFSDASNNDFTIDTSSTAYQAGNLAYNSATLDLAHNARTSEGNTVINIGAYEGASKVTPTFNFTQPTLTFGDVPSELTITSNSTGTRTYELFTDMAGTMPDTTNGRSVSSANGDTITLTVGNAGTTYLKVSTTETTTHAAGEQIFEITIDKADPVLSWNDQSILLFSTLTAQQLNATADVSGTFAYYENYDDTTGMFSTLILQDFHQLVTAGPTILYASFTPTDTANYNTGFTSSNVNVVSSLIIHVNEAATGTNNGSTWTDAYTSLETAFANFSQGQEIWVAQGSYKTSQTTNTNNMLLLGGFNGTETTKTERNWNQNPTIISGDVNSNGIGDFGIDLQDLVVIEGSNAFVDGFIFEHSLGIALDLTTEATVQNCIFRNITGNSSFAISSSGSSVTISNCLFYDNATDASVGTVTSSATPLTVINSTFNNTTSGNGIKITSGQLVTHNTIFANGSAAHISVNAGINNSATSNHTLFDTALPSDVIDGTGNIFNANPLFVDAATNDYNLQPSSPAVNIGNNSINTASFDLNKNDRIVLSTIDLGAYENTGLNNQIITFNPLVAVNLGDSDFDLTATASSGLAVSYSSSDTSVATISGNTVTLVGAGTTTITASQAGDANFEAAINVTQVLTVNPPITTDQTVTATPTSGICSVDATVSLASSQLGIDYYLRDDTTNAIVEGPVSGTNAAISFANETLTNDKTYNVYAVHADERINTFQFDDVDGYVSIPSTINDEFTNNRITIETWAYIPSSDDTDQFTTLVTGEFDGATVPYTIYINSGAMGTGFYNAGWTEITGVSYPKDQWIHVASTYDQNNIKLYINGTEVASLAATAAIPVNSFGWRMGRRWDGPQNSTRLFGGALAETRIWNTARSSSEITTNMNTIITNETGLVASYTYSAEAGTTITDQTGNGFDGSLIALAGDSTNWIVPNGALEMSMTPTVTITPVEDQIVTLAQADTQSATVSIANSQIGVDYYVRDNSDDAVIEGPIAGTGNAIDFSTETITADKTYNVFAEAGSCNLQLTNTPTATYSRLLLSAKAYLQGAAFNPNTGEETLMRDDLRVASLLPTTSPYTDGITCDASVFNITGSDAIVDWIWVELRDKSDNTMVLHSTSALLQRDGDIVSVDGTSPLAFFTFADDFFITIKHRNHMGILSLNAITLSSSNTTVVDFSDTTNQITFGSNAQTTSEMPTNIVAMWAGNVNGDTLIQYSGTDPDTPNILSLVLNDAGNFLNFPTFVVSGYLTNDINMDGSTQYSGTTPDTPFILQNILAHPGNFLNFSTYQILEQLPEN
ncbi:LamG domain-containing protein [uncultured Kordia sp.]|uniref:LamG domain-containing protein n=1 Tax=uncultured Kordia sp. TaxID=507699 RepID=UPI0026087039|nr:LamG domain-containing protein [uncultured Kordia sp.]